MKFGKLPDISNVDFTLPADAELTTPLLNSLKQINEIPQLYVGCTGWSMKEWHGSVYPKKTSSKDYLKHYSDQFNTIEFNTTHYRIPTFETIHKWYHESKYDFHFCPKIPQVISHSRELGYLSGSVEAFTDVIRGLKEKLGHCFMQMPPYFSKDKLPVLKIFLEDFPEDIPLSVEFRHPSWFENPAAFEEAARLLEDYRVATVITDVAGRRDVLHQRLTSDTAVIRFVGNDLHPTDYQRIDDWIKRLKIWFDQGLQKVYFFTHEPDNVQAPQLADYLVREAKKHLEVITRGPDLKKHSAGDQMTLF